MPSPSFSINAGSPLTKAKIAKNGSATCLLDDTTGVAPVTWSIVLCDDTTTASSWLNKTQSGAVGQQYDFDAPTDAEGVCCIVECTVAGGNDAAGNPDPSMTARAKVWVPTSGGAEVLAAGELSPDPNTDNPEAALWSSLTHGAATPVNALVRGLLTSSSSVSGGTDFVESRWFKATVAGGAAATTVYTYTPSANGQFDVFAVVHCVDSAGDLNFYYVGGTYKRVAGVVTAIVASDRFAEHAADPTWILDWSTDATNITLKLTPDGVNDTVISGYFSVFGTL